MNDDLLTSALAAVRDTGCDDGELVAMTRSRLRRTLESRARGRRQLVSFLTMTAILFGGTMSWALSTGRTVELWTAVAGPAVGPETVRVIDRGSPVSGERSPAVERSRVAAAGARRAPEPVVVAPPVLALPADEPVAVEAKIEAKLEQPIEAKIETKPIETKPIEAKPPVEAPPAPVRRPVTVPAPRPAVVEVLYRKAHELHFHGADHPATLAAWDAYLASEPTGRFVVEARYNRALILIRLGRYAEAREALAPFAHGEVQPAGYRAAEAGKLVERLDDLLRAP